MNLKEVIKFNTIQLTHIRLVQSLIQYFTNILTRDAIKHDVSKFSSVEYEAFIASTDSLAPARDGFDPEYQKHLKGDAIQHHIKSNPHHPEAWPKGEMPFTHIVAMYFDWLSRSIEKGTSMDDFWSYNIKKLIDHQPHAISIVESLKKEFPSEMFDINPAGDPLNF